MASRPTVAVVGANADRRKFGNKSVRAHQAAGYDVYPVHPTEPVVEGLTAYRTVGDIPVEKLDRISVYLPPPVAEKALASFTAKPVGEVWLNPGVESDAVLAKAAELGLTVVCGCSIVDVGYSPGQFGDA
jgi:predicted CoA-binding protein